MKKIDKVKLSEILKDAFGDSANIRKLMVEIQKEKLEEREK